MADIKLFRLSGGKASELAGSEVALEKALQTLIEKNLEIRVLGAQGLEHEKPFFEKSCEARRWRGAAR